MKRYSVIAAALGLALGAAAVPAIAQTTKFQGQLSGSQEVPPKQGGGSGKAAATLNGNTLDYTIEYTGLSGPATAAHFHGPAEAGANAGVAVPISNPASPIKGTATLNDQQKADLMAGKWYANVHTAQNPNGEIRGQMQPAR